MLRAGPILFIIFSFYAVHGATVWECSTRRPDEPSDGDCYEMAFESQQNLDWVPDPADPDSGEDVMRVFYPKGSYAGNQTNKGGINFYIDDMFAPADSVTFTYDIYFSDNFGWARGGKLPGLFGGFGQCSGGTSGDTDCFSARYMWRQNGDGEIYGYIPNETGDWFCSLPNNRCNFDFGHSFGRGTFRFERNRWQTISQRIDLNTRGFMDSEMTIYYEGQEVYTIVGLEFRDLDIVQINSVYFSTFFGGSSSPDYAAPDDCYTYYKNLRVTVHDNGWPR